MIETISGKLRENGHDTICKLYLNIMWHHRQNVKHSRQRVNCKERRSCWVATRGGNGSLQITLPQYRRLWVPRCFGIVGGGLLLRFCNTTHAHCIIAPYILRGRAAASNQYKAMMWKGTRVLFIYSMHDKGL